MPSLRGISVMQLKRGGGIKYGIPYQGSKAKIMPILARMFPPADNFYDLFGGGFSVTHFMMENRAKSYKQFHYNELRPGLPQLIKDAIDGKYNFEVFRPEWISRERFLDEKETNPYVKIIWSFGNNGEGYLFGKEIEEPKRSMHQAVIFNEFDSFMKNVVGLNKWPNDLDYTGRRLYLKKICRKRIDLQQLEQLERLERLQQLEHLQQKLCLTNIDYRDVQIKQNSVIYCDIPYKGTADYGGGFSHKDFFDWAANQEHPVFISEYNINDDRFFVLKEMAHRSTFSSGGSKNIPVIEKLYGNKQAFEIIKSHKKITPDGRT